MEDKALNASTTDSLLLSPNSMSARVVRSHSFQDKKINIVKVDGEIKPYLPDDAIPQQP